MTEREFASQALTKVPAITLGFWIIKILATTLGETAGDSVTMTYSKSGRRFSFGVRAAF